MRIQEEMSRYVNFKANDDATWGTGNFSCMQIAVTILNVHLQIWRATFKDFIYLIIKTFKVV